MQDSRAVRVLGDYPAKRLSKAASKPAERGSLLAVPPLNFIKSYIKFLSFNND